MPGWCGAAIWPPGSDRSRGGPHGCRADGEKRGAPSAEATREGAILRLRPIMMTALVAAYGLLPAALATGVGTDSQRAFALVIVSGLFTRLLISIFLMPVLYTLVRVQMIAWKCDDDHVGIGLDADIGLARKFSRPRVM